MAAISSIQQQALRAPKRVPGGEELLDGEMLGDLLEALVNGVNETHIDIMSAAAMIKGASPH